jgi:intracellular multiplication protein IcmO
MSGLELNRSLFGVDRNADLNPGLIRRDARPFRYRAAEFTTNYKGHVFVILAVIIGISPIMAAMPGMSLEVLWFSDLAILITPIFYLYSKSKIRKYPFRKPMMPEDKVIDWEDGGMFILGEDYFDGAQVSFSNSDVRTHMLVFGSTGSGKTRFLLGLMYQAMLMGAGAMYVDGKADNTVFWLLYSLARRLGREDDILVINYLTGGETISNDKGEEKVFKRISNTSNLLAHGSSEQLRSLLVGLMREAGGDGAMWKGRASAMLKGLLNALVYLRDAGEINLDVEKLREYMPLERILELFGRRDLPDSAKVSIHRYLNELPGFTEQSAMEGNLNPEAYKQHGFLLMQLTEVLSDLSDTYGHIFSAPLGEVDFKDVVFNRRILFVMLPALEKDPDSLAGLGKLVVAGVRSALAPALGNSVEGSYREVVKSKPTTAKVPFLIILDEYGYYSVLGFAVVAAQARSLGVAVVFAGQDYPSFKKGSEEEAASTIANTNIKICMKLEDPKETADLFVTRGGESATTEVSGYSKENSSNYQDNLSSKIDRRKRIDARDLVAQKPGEAHIIFGDSIVRGRFFYADPEQSKHARLNHFVMVDKGSEATLNRINSAYENFQKRLDAAKSPEGLSDDDLEDTIDPGLAVLFSDMKEAIKRRSSLQEASIYAAGMIELRESLKDVAMTEEIKKEARKSAGKSDSEIEEFSEILPGLDSDDDIIANVKGSSPKSFLESLKSNLIEDTFTPPGMSDDEFEETSPTAPTSPSEEEEQHAVLEALHDKNKPTVTAKAGADKVGETFRAMMQETLQIKFAKDSGGKPLTPAAIKATDPQAVITDLEVKGGSSVLDAEASAIRAITEMAQGIQYPELPGPKKQPAEMLRSRLEGFLKKVQDGSD